MAFTVTVNPRLRVPTIWTAQNNQVNALNTIALIKMRTMRGVSSKGAKFKKYSTKKIYISLKGARLKPKGGRLSRTGNQCTLRGVIESIRKSLGLVIFKLLRLT